MKKIPFIILLALILLAAAGFLFYRHTRPVAIVKNFQECAAAGNPIMESNPRMCRGEDGTFFTETIASTSTSSPVATPLEDTSDMIRFTNLKSGQVITSPMIVKGEAQGSWFFEAVFPGELLDENGSVISNFSVQAKGDWTTPEFVPFEARLEFQNPGGAGTLVFKKDNPSGLPQNDESVRIPIRFPALSGVKLQVYFPNDHLAPGDLSCSKTFPISRTVTATSAPARAAISELLKGLTSDEKDKGYSTQINEGVILQKISIIDGTAYADFNEKLEEGGGSCSRAIIENQIVSTLKQFSTVTKVVISIDGRTKDILQP